MQEKKFGLEEKFCDAIGETYLGRICTPAELKESVAGNNSRFLDGRLVCCDLEVEQLDTRMSFFFLFHKIREFLLFIIISTTVPRKMHGRPPKQYST